MENNGKLTEWSFINDCYVFGTNDYDIYPKKDSFVVDSLNDGEKRTIKDIEDETGKLKKFIANLPSGFEDVQGFDMETYK